MDQNPPNNPTNPPQQPIQPQASPPPTAQTVVIPSAQNTLPPQLQSINTLASMTPAPAPVTAAPIQQTPSNAIFADPKGAPVAKSGSATPLIVAGSVIAVILLELIIYLPKLWN